MIKIDSRELKQVIKRELKKELVPYLNEFKEYVRQIKLIEKRFAQREADYQTLLKLK